MAEKPKYREMGRREAAQAVGSSAAGRRAARMHRDMGRLESSDVKGTTAVQRKDMRGPEKVLSRAIKGDRAITVGLVEEMLSKMRVLDKERAEKDALPSGTVRLRHSNEAREATKFFSPSFQGGVRGILEGPSADYWYKRENWEKLRGAAESYLKSQRRRSVAKKKLKARTSPFSSWRAASATVPSTRRGLTQAQEGTVSPAKKKLKAKKAKKAKKGK